MLRHLLLAFDGSDHARRAAALAGALAGRFGARLTVLQVVPPGEVPDELRRMAEVEGLVEPRPQPGAVAPVPGAYGTLAAATPAVEPVAAARAVAERLAKTGAGLARDAGATGAEVLVEPGDPAEVILASAERLGVDLIVMGSRGLGRLQRLLLGSVSTKVTQHAPCAVLTVR